MRADASRSIRQDHPARASSSTATSYQVLGPVPEPTCTSRARSIPADRCIFLGADRLGRDVFSRLIQGTRISLSIGLVGVRHQPRARRRARRHLRLLRRRIDFAIQRVIEFVLRACRPSRSGWALAAAIRTTWPPALIYFTITAILSLTRLDAARARGARPLPLAAQRGFRHRRAARRLRARGGIIFRHMLPSFIEPHHRLVTLAIPAMILAETALSFLGLGLQPPTISLGRAAAGGAEHPRRSPPRPGCCSPGAGGGHRGDGAQLPRRRPARRRRSLRQVS